MAYRGVKRNDLTADFVRSILDYDPETGILTWRRKAGINGKGNFKVGDVAGSRKKGQIMIGVCDQRYCAHRLAWLWMTGKWPSEIDHVNRDPFDNRWVNLREATRSQNNANKPSTSPFKGVSFDKRKNAWRARVKVNRKERWLGYFETAEEAHEAYRRAAQEIWGEFHCAT